MTKIARFVLWLCKKFTRQELEEIIRRLQEILAEREPEIKPRDDFRVPVAVKEFLEQRNVRVEDRRPSEGASCDVAHTTPRP